MLENVVVPVAAFVWVIAPVKFTAPVKATVPLLVMVRAVNLAASPLPNVLEKATDPEPGFKVSVLAPPPVPSVGTGKVIGPLPFDVSTVALPATVITIVTPDISIELTVMLFANWKPVAASEVETVRVFGRVVAPTVPDSVTGPAPPLSTSDSTAVVVALILPTTLKAPPVEDNVTVPPPATVKAPPMLNVLAVDVILFDVLTAPDVVKAAADKMVPVADFVKRPLLVTAMLPVVEFMLLLTV